ncbi:MAG: hypothetical protein JXQ76_08240, partial [Campylobacterales bacterium]|nr:hypothetical protein [Campylobacterales bacterium]
MGKLAKNSLFTKLSILLALVIITIVTLYQLYNYYDKKAKIIKEIKQEAKQSLTILQNDTLHFIESYSINEYQQILKNKIANSDIHAITLEDYAMGKLLSREAFTTIYIKNDHQEVQEYSKEAMLKCFYQKETLL